MVTKTELKHRSKDVGISRSLLMPCEQISTWLVNQPLAGATMWSPVTTAAESGGTCTLTCMVSLFNLLWLMDHLLVFISSVNDQIPGWQLVKKPSHWYWSIFFFIKKNKTKNSPLVYHCLKQAHTWKSGVSHDVFDSGPNNINARMCQPINSTCANKSSVGSLFVYESNTRGKGRRFVHLVVAKLSSKTFHYTLSMPVLTTWWSYRDKFLCVCDSCLSCVSSK